MTTVNDIPVIIIWAGDDATTVQATLETLEESGMSFIYVGKNTTIKYEPGNTNTGFPVETLDLALAECLPPELESIKNGPFWSQQGRQKKGGRRQY